MNLKDLQKNEQRPGRTKIKGQRYTEHEWADIVKAAKTAGMLPSRFVRACVLTQAREINDRTKHLKIAK